MADNTAKQHAAREAAAHVQPGTRLGLGSGTTIYLVIAALGERLRSGQLAGLRAVTASRWSAQAAREAGIEVETLDEQPVLDLAIDGADEVDGQLNMIKGGGGALLHERIVLAAAAQRLIVVDESKLVRTLGERFALPIEVVPFGWRNTLHAIQRLLPDARGEPVLRRSGGENFVTDEGNWIIDWPTGPINDPQTLARELRAVPGVMDHGLFLGYAEIVLVGSAAGVRRM